VKNILNNIQMRMQSRSYIDALHSILTHKGWVTCPKYMLAGMTVIAYRFSVHRHLTAQSVTAYNWMGENFLAVDFIGVTSSQDAGFSFAATFPLYQSSAVSTIKKSIDSGAGVVIWNDSFVVAVGYDDEKEVLYYTNGSESDDGFKELSYSQFGCNESPYWYYQVLESKIQLDEMEVYKESLVQAIYKWEVHDLMLPEEEYACGRMAYDAVIHALCTQDYDKAGAWETIVGYAVAKRDIHLYTQSLERIWPECKAVADAYAKLAHLYERIVQHIAVDHPKQHRTVEPEQAEALVQLFLEAKEVEETAIAAIKALMHETVTNRFHNIGLR
jgi:hypothetical protein